MAATVDRKVIRTDGADLAFITVRVTNENHLTVPTATNPITFAVEGPGEIVATDSGDPTDLTPFPAHEREASNGLCLVIIRAKDGQPGRIVLTASGEGLTDAILSITASRGDR